VVTSKDLITAMDDAIDQMQKTAKAIVLFELLSFAPQMRSVADSIAECAPNWCAAPCRCWPTSASTPG
jgi:uncharacterized protein Yka (UPF0111/DUF47 family)